ncbi:putative DNA binding domain-containing protein [Shimazuella sp. AN120528]|uniref:RNA-binding domain-containing protein n=1 Tax=Shimazuella soli TaxID=1892854 RepID=UPI001F0E287A|nr:RNA-binding domain-containing protein [Shimazuella soli]MCH5585932.1 putative DNA binding domain-containing protein [Shimazuella soli]
MHLTEDFFVELKQQYSDEIKKSVIAFANTKGGTIYIGISDSGNIIGVENIDETILKVSNTIRDAIKPDITLFVDYLIEQIEGKDIVKVVVQKGTASPYYLSGKGIRPEGVFVRQGAASVPASETAILKMIKDTDGEKYENLRSINQDLTFEVAEKSFAERGVSFGASQKKTLKLMNEDGIYTNLGLLLSDQCIHTVKLAVFEGATKAIFKDRCEFSGSLLKQLNETYAFIDRYNRTRAEFEGLYRIDRRDYPIDALREALLNSLVHRDYSFSSSTLISIFDDRIEFVSIGGLVKGISFDDIMLGVSITRNEGLADVFYRLKLIEAYGTGMPKIMDSFKSYGIEPRVEVTDHAFKITLPNVNQKIAQENKHHHLSRHEQIVLKLLQEKESIVRKDVEKVLSLSQAMAVKILKGLVEKGAIRSIGKGRNTTYIAVDGRS